MRIYEGPRAETPRLAVAAVDWLPRRVAAKTPRQREVLEIGFLMMQNTLTNKGTIRFHAGGSCRKTPHQLKSRLNFSFGRLDVSVGRASGDKALELLATLTRLLSEYDAGRTGATDELAKAVFDYLRPTWRWSMLTIDVAPRPR